MSDGARSSHAATPSEQSRSGQRVDAQPVIAAVDLGSNSFHMIVARHADGHLTVLDRLREMVRFAAGLDDRGRVSGPAAEQALACLQRFGQRLRDMHAESVRAVGTNTFRRAKNAADFLRQAEDALGHPIEIISGREEARLIYLGAAHTSALSGRRLVVDIGGGSTELIVGEGLETRELLSLYMGCVSMSEEYFPGGKLTSKRLKRARLAARMELEPVSVGLRRLGWEHVLGCSGTIRVTETLLRGLNLSNDGITLAGMEQLAKRFIDFGHIDAVELPGLSAERAPVYIGGLAILLGVFEALALESMRVSDGSLREGLLYDLLGRLTDEDARARTVRAMQARYHIDRQQADQTQAAALAFHRATREKWKLERPLLEKSLVWAAQLHEIGLAIAHAQYHRHGAYLLEHADMPGFSRQEQMVLARLVRAHRRKITPAIFADLPSPWCERLPYLAVLLRLATLLNRSRSPAQLPELDIEARKRGLKLRFPDGWLDAHALTEADLEREARYLKGIGIELSYR